MSVAPLSLENQVLSLIADNIMELANNFPVDGNLFDQGLDSMAIMQLLLVLEEHMGVAIAVGEVTKENFRSAKSISQLIREKRGESPPILTASELDSKPAESLAEPPASAASVPFAYPEGLILTRLTESDCFVRSNERLMVQTGQGLHLVSSVLDLERAPNIGQLRMAMRRLMERHPMLSCEFSQSFFGLPSYKRGTNPAKEIPLELWCEEGAPGESKAWGAKPIADARAYLETLPCLTEAQMNAQGTCHIRCDLIEKRKGGYLFILTWRHIILDGVGAELFLCEIDHTAADRPGFWLPPLDLTTPPSLGTWSERFKRATPMKNFLNELSRKKVRSLAGPKPARGALRFEILELDQESSQRVREREQRFCGPVMTLPFHAACAVRAHDLAWRHRGEQNLQYMVTVPAQSRRKGAKGPMFQNNLSMLFLTATSEEAQSLPAMVESLGRQHERYLKERLGESFQEMQKLMGHMPPWLYTSFIRLHMRGEMTSFFFSGTGTFAADLHEFVGARIRNAYHVPSINRPPGTGLFLNDKNGFITLVLSYREGVLSPDERALLRDGFAEALTGEWPNRDTLPLRQRLDVPSV